MAPTTMSRLATITVLIFQIGTATAFADPQQRQGFITDCIQVDKEIMAHIPAARERKAHPHPDKLCACLYDNLEPNFSPEDLTYIVIRHRGLLNTARGEQARADAAAIGKSKKDLFWLGRMWSHLDLVDRTIVVYCDQRTRDKPGGLPLRRLHANEPQINPYCPLPPPIQ